MIVPNKQNHLNCITSYRCYPSFHSVIQKLIVITYIGISFQSRVTTSENTRLPTAIFRIPPSTYNSHNTNGLITQNQSTPLKTSDIPRINGGTVDPDYCGYLIVDMKPHQMLVDIIQGQRISQTKFKKIYDKFKEGSVILMNDACTIEICGFSSTAPGDFNKGSCKYFYDTESPVDDVPYSFYYEITSISCACQKPNRTNCEKMNCSSRAMDYLTQRDVCGVLYQERNCQDCMYEKVLLENGGFFGTKNSAVVKSFAVRPGCEIELKTFGYLYSPETPTSFFYNMSRAVVEPTYSKRGEEFFCTCTDEIIPESRNVPYKTTPLSISTSSVINNKSLVKNDFESQQSSSISSMTIVISIIGGLLGVVGISLIILLVLLISKRHTKNLHQPIVLTKEEIRNFKEGARNRKKGNSIEMEDFSPGYCKALDLPYDQKFELMRSDIQFNPTDPNAIIGEGEFGVVYKGMFAGLGDNRFQDVAVKTLRTLSQRKTQNVKALLNEIKVLSYIGYHPNIVYFVGACTVNLERGEVFLVLKLCHGGSLKKYLIDEQRGLISLWEEDSLPEDDVSSEDDDEEAIEGYMPDSIFVPNKNKKKELPQKLFNNLVKWSEEIATGMEYLTTKHVIHVDLAARNVLLSDDLTAKISDFGLSRKLYDKLDYEKGGKEPIPIKGVALESLTKKTYSEKSDVWGYGITEWEIFSLGEDPYERMSPLEIFSTLSNGRRLDCPKFATKAIYDEILKCWNENPEERPTFTYLKNFFKNLRENYFTEVLDS